MQQVNQHSPGPKSPGETFQVRAPNGKGAPAGVTHG